MNAPLFPVAPRIRLRIGVSGHRVPPKLPKEAEAPIRATLDRILSVVLAAARAAEKDYEEFRPTGYAGIGQAAADALASKFVIVSSVAEGSDRIIAEAGFAAGFTLEVVLPFGRDEYERDFETEASRAHFRRLLDRATAVFELDGTTEGRPRAYEAAGFVMLANIDILVAIWDGKEAAGIGGTEHVVSRAIADGIPVLWIDPARPDAINASWSRPGEVPLGGANAQPKDTFRPADDVQIATVIHDIVALPKQPTEKDALRRYLSEREQRWNFCPWYPLLLWIYRVRSLPRSDFQLAPALKETNTQWQKYLTILPTDRSQRPAIEDILLPAFSAADHIAIYYSHVYRSSYVFNFLFAAFAVALALSGVFLHNKPDIKSIFVCAELAVIGTILVGWLNGRRQQWHRRWLDYRRLAECLRHMRIFAPLGAEGSVDRPRRSLDVGEADWVNWYAWSLRRLIPLPHRAVDASYLEAMRNVVLETELDGQIQYHRRNTERMTELDHRIHRSGELLFAITGTLCLIFLGLAWSGVLPGMDQEIRDVIANSFTFLTALLPTLGAALAAIHVQGDFKTVADQSKRTEKRLTVIEDALKAEEPAFARLCDRIEKTSDVMMSDLLEWQTVFRTRPLALPA